METEIAADMDAWQPVDPLDMTDTQEAQHELVLAATNALASELMGELMAALKASEQIQVLASHDMDKMGIASRTFVVEVCVELSKVTWPTRKETWSQTIVVIVVSIIAAIILGVFDAFWAQITDLIYDV